MKPNKNKSTFKIVAIFSGSSNGEQNGHLAYELLITLNKLLAVSVSRSLPNKVANICSERTRACTTALLSLCRRQKDGWMVAWLL